MTEETLLLRQIHPAFVQADRVTSQAFRPTPKDQQLLSVYDGDMISAAAAYQHFTSMPNCQSHGVLAVTVQECIELNLSARPDPDLFPEHAVIDFTGLSNNQCEKKGKHLCSMALQRGWLFLYD